MFCDITKGMNLKSAGIAAQIYSLGGEWYVLKLVHIVRLLKKAGQFGFS